jgi:hypothetical protein
LLLLLLVVDREAPTVKPPDKELGDHGVETRFRVQAEVVCFYPASVPALGPTQPPMQYVPEECCQELERSVSKTDNLLSSCAHVKNSGVIPPLLSQVLMAWYLVKHKSNITLSSIILGIYVR